MAKMPVKPAMPKPAPDADEDDAGAGAADGGTESAGDSDDDAGAADGDVNGEVLLTVMDMGDGTYKLIAGDEDQGEDDQSQDDGEGADASADVGGEADASGGMDAGSSEPEGQTFSSLGSLLKGILDLVRDHESESSGEGTDSDNFQAGFAGGSSASPPRPSMAQKY